MAEAKLRHLSSSRRLAAIMFTDIVGYTKMMAEDEAKALSVLRINRETHKKLIYQFGGQFLKEMGDGILASFENSSDAVICAAAIQKNSIESNIELRIGIHMGEVTFENNDVFGDGVNIASRIQPLAESGQILISETVHNDVRNKPGITTHLLGEKNLKNVAKAKILYVVDVHEDFLTPGARAARKNQYNPVLMGSIALLIMAITAYAGFWWGKNSQEPPGEGPVIRYNIDLNAPLGRTGAHSLAFSPDGKSLAYVSQNQLFLKSMEEMGPGLPVGGVFDPRGLFFSPDGNWIGFDDPGNSQLMKVSVKGGNPIQICSLEGTAHGRNWYEEGIFFGMNNSIYRVNANGGVPEKIYTVDSIGNTSWVSNPQLLPDKKTLLFNQYSLVDQLWSIRTVQLESENDSEILFEGAQDGRYLKSGYVAYLKDGSLQAVPFDPDSKRITGQPLVLTSDPIRTNTDNGQFAFNNHGTLVYYTTAETGDSNTERHLVWIDLSGNIERISKEPALLMSPRISSDGQLIAIDQIEADGTFKIALYDPVLGTSTDFIALVSAITPAWSPGNKVISYFQLDDPRGVYSKPIDLSSPPKLLFESEEIIHLGNWSKDGHYLLFRSSKGIGYYDSSNDSVKFMDFLNEGKGIELFYPSLSPDGKWLAFTSDDDKFNDNTFVVPFPGPGRAHRITVDEGFAPVWAPDMTALYFVGLDSIGFNVSRVNIETKPQFSSSVPEVLFYGTFSTQYIFSNSSNFDFGNTGMFDIHPDGDRLLMENYVGSYNNQEVIRPNLKVIVNWPGLVTNNK